MSSHPNVILQVNITPDGLSRKTMRNIMEAYRGETGEEEDTITIEGNEYDAIIMESDYYEPSQLSAKEGDLVFYDLVTYGFGETIQWDDLAAMKEALETWAKEVCAKFSCKYEIHVGANYW